MKFIVFILRNNDMDSLCIVFSVLLFSLLPTKPKHTKTNATFTSPPHKDVATLLISPGLEGFANEKLAADTWLWVKKKIPKGTTGSWVYFSFNQWVTWEERLNGRLLKARANEVRPCLIWKKMGPTNVQQGSHGISWHGPHGAI